MRFKRLFCEITGKCLDGRVNDFDRCGISNGSTADSPPKACFGLQFSKNSLFLIWRPVSLDCIRHHPVAPNRVFFRQVQIGRLRRDFALPVSGPFGLYGRMVSLAAISVAPSPHPKIPFLADKAQHIRLLSHGSRTSAALATVVFLGVRYCGFNPSASNCRLHSAGASRSRSMLMPRGRRPSTAARTSLGARKASEMVMLT
jgi:hypothetical protein